MQIKLGGSTHERDALVSYLGIKHRPRLCLESRSGATVLTAAVKLGRSWQSHPEQVAAWLVKPQKSKCPTLAFEDALAGVLTLFYEHFIKTDLLNRSCHQTLDRAYDLRQQGDYGVAPVITREMARKGIRTRAGKMRKNTELVLTRLYKSGRRLILMWKIAPVPRTKNGPRPWARF